MSYKSTMPQHSQGNWCDKLSQYHIEWGRAESISTKIWNQTGMPTFAILLKYSSKVLSRAIRQEKSEVY